MKKKGVDGTCKSVPHSFFFGNEICDTFSMLELTMVNGPSPVFVIRLVTRDLAGSLV